MASGRPPEELIQKGQDLLEVLASFSPENEFTISRTADELFCLGPLADESRSRIGYGHTLEEAWVDYCRKSKEALRFKPVVFKSKNSVGPGSTRIWLESIDPTKKIETPERGAILLVTRTMETMKLVASAPDANVVDVERAWGTVPACDIGLGDEILNLGSVKLEDGA